MQCKTSAAGRVRLNLCPLSYSSQDKKDQNKTERKGKLLLWVVGWIKVFMGLVQVTVIA